MLETLESLAVRFAEIDDLLARSDVASDPDQVSRLAKERADLQPVVNAYQQLQTAQGELADARALANDDDPELAEMAEDELPQIAAKIDRLEKELRHSLVPKDPNDEKNVIMEIRAGTGGDEAALFAADLFRMYLRFAEQKLWKVEILDSSPTELGGYKEIIAAIRGDQVYNFLRHESGIHRVQRVPETESSGRIHTSAATVAVLPEAEEVDVRIDDKDLRIDVFRASGPGGQSVNTTDSAVRITHIPSGIVVSQQDEKSQHKNRAKAMKVLRARLYEAERSAQAAERAATRWSQVGSGDRSERVRTYNFPQGRVTDHRIGLTLHKLEKVLEGEALDELIDALIKDDEATRLAEIT